MSAGSNKFGHLFQWTSFGESHGPAMGVVIDGCPAGVSYNESLLLTNLAKRRPGQDSGLTTDRKEKDFPEILSGVFENKTLGTPIAVVVRNQDQRSKDYDQVKMNPRIGHADDLWKNKFGHSDHRGGGRASARETVNWVIAGSFAQMFCKTQAQGLNVQVRLTKVGSKIVTGEQDENLVDYLKSIKDEQDSVGGQVEVCIENPPANLGEPIFKKIKAELTAAFMTINAVCAVELGGGFAMTEMKGSEAHTQRDSKIYGGVRGGITTGEPIFLKLGFKPTSSIKDIAKHGRHDPCVVLRALPVIEAMAWSVLADQILMAKLNHI